jgi:hypothetical protein
MQFLPNFTEFAWSTCNADHVLQYRWEKTLKSLKIEVGLKL